MKKAWTDIKSFITVTMTFAYIFLAITKSMTSEFQNIYLMIVAFYFGTQHEKKVASKKEINSNDNNLNDEL